MTRRNSSVKREVKKDKPKRKKAGWRLTDRKCRLQKKVATQDQALQEHHISYGTPQMSKITKARPEPKTLHPAREKDIKYPVLFESHNIIHCRCKWPTTYEKKYGKDFGAVKLALDILTMYEPVMEEALAYIKTVDTKREN